MVSKYFADAPLNIPVKYKVRQMANKMELLDREIKYLLNKVKIWKPKQEITANQTTDSKAEYTIEENGESAADSDTEKDKSAEEQSTSNNVEEQPTSNNVEDQQESTLETTDTTQDPLLLPESEKPQLTKERVQKNTHQEL